MLVDIIRIVDLPIDWVKCGRLGREEGVLAIATQGGGLCVKIFRRVATTEPSSVALEESLRHARTLSKAIEVPKKSKEFVEQSLRERENPQLIHQIYQRDWFMLKLHTAKTYARLVSGQTPLLATSSEREPVQITYDLLGFGPQFKLLIRVVATGKLDPGPRYIACYFNEAEYEPDRRILPLPATLPVNRWFQYAVRVKCKRPEKQLQEEEAEVRLLLVRRELGRPLWATSFAMPQSEPEVG